MITAARNIAAGLILAGSLLAPTLTHASTTRFFLDWSGDLWGNSAQAQGILTIDDNLFSNLNDYELLTPGNEINNFSLTVSGANTGNGIFHLSDFDGFSWSTRGLLDLSQELMGQATTGGPWGSYFGADALAGDFNLIASESSTAPLADGAFLIRTNNGSGDRLNLISFRPVPIPAAIWLFGSVLAGFLGITQKRRT